MAYKITKEYIIKKVRGYNKDSLLNNLFYSLQQYDLEELPNYPIWHYFLLIKWSILYGRNTVEKNLTAQKYKTLLKYMEQYETKALNPYVGEHDWDKFFQIIGYQQFYLQQNVHWSDFAIQLKLLGPSLKSKYDIEKSFVDKTQLSILDFIFFTQVIWMFTQANKMNKGLIYKGHIGEEIFEMMREIFECEANFKKYIALLSLNKSNIEKSIKRFKTGINNSSLEVFEMSFFTSYPFVVDYDSKYHIVHRKTFDYTCKYYLYDFLKNNDEKFTEEFGKRFEKYVGLGLEECNTNYIGEKDLIKDYSKKEKVVDYIVENQILIECKAIEPKPLSSVVPENDIIYNAFKDSIFKAYLKQMLNIIKLKNNIIKPQFGVIICYKDFYLSSLDDFKDVLARDIENICKENGWVENPLPLENVFVISINNWDVIIELIKEKKVTLLGLLEDAVASNRKEKSKWLLNLLKNYGETRGELSYLLTEKKILDEKFTSPQRN